MTQQFHYLVYQYMYTPKNENLSIKNIHMNFYSSII